MTAADSGGHKSKGVLLDALDGLTMLGIRLGAIVFVVVTVYLLWGIFAGPLGKLSTVSREEYVRLWTNVRYACTALTISGLVLIFSSAIRYYTEEVTGYILLIAGAACYWGVPIAIGSTLRSVRFAGAQVSPFGQVFDQYQLLGTVALAVALPFIVADFWYKLRGIRRTSSIAPKTAARVAKQEEAPRSRLYLFCWQMPYCRDYLRKYCKAYELKKSCWLIKSGCYCDEEMILRVMKSGKTSGFDQKFTGVSGKSRELTPAEKRQRCRDCFLYQEHQRQKYRLLSPLVFPITIGLMWMYLKPVKVWLAKALIVSDQVVGRMSFSQGAKDAAASSTGVSDVVLWMFLICIGLVVITYLLRALEYCVFDLQI